MRGGRELVDPWSVEERSRKRQKTIDYDDDDFEKEFNGSSADESKQGLYGALFLRQIQDVGVVEEEAAPTSKEFILSDFSDYNMEADELEKWVGSLYLLLVNAQDKEGRTLQVHARMSEEYVDLETWTTHHGYHVESFAAFYVAGSLDGYLCPGLKVLDWRLSISGLG